MAGIVHPYNLGSDNPSAIVFTIDRVGRRTRTEKARALMEDRKKRAAGLNATDIRNMAFIPWSRIERTLLGLNPNIWFEDNPEELIAICLRTPSAGAVRRWEKVGLRWSDQQYVKALQGSDIGPSRKMTWASKGLIAPFSDLVSTVPTMSFLSRSLSNILRICIEAHQAFTWAEAELAFGITFRGRPTHPVFINCAVDLWGRSPEMGLRAAMRPVPQNDKLIAPSEYKKPKWREILSA